MIECERKFLISSSPPIEKIIPKFFRQGYLVAKSPQVRIRIIDNAKAYWTIKFKTGDAGTRYEFEEQINDLATAEELFARCEYQLSKYRYELPIEGTKLKWEIDFYKNSPPVAEIELPNMNYPLPEKPYWLGEEITGNKKYSNLRIAGYLQ